MDRQFENRFQAGRLLASQLTAYASQPDLLVLGVPRGGVPVAYEIAAALHAPLDVFVVRKLWVPGQKTVSMGAIASESIVVLNDDVLRSLQVPEKVVEIVIADEREALRRREAAYHEDRPAASVESRTIILADDGLVTGTTLRAAVKALKRRGAARIVAAVPVADPEACRTLSREVDDVVCAVAASPLKSLSSWYQDFPQTSDEEARILLHCANEESLTTLAGAPVGEQPVLSGSTC